MAQFNANQFRQRMQAAQREYERAVRDAQRKVNDYNRKANEYNRRGVADINAYNRRVAAHNQQVVRQTTETNRQAEAYHRSADEHNRQMITEANNALRNARQPRPAVSYTPEQSALVERVQDAVGVLPATQETDAFLSYARIDGATTVTASQTALQSLELSVWSTQHRSSRATACPGRLARVSGKPALASYCSPPAYLTGRFWTERELGVLLHKNTVIPVLHDVTFEDVGEYSGILTDLAGFTTEHDTIETIAAKIAEAVLSPGE
jgi:hypothetical protein